MEAPYKKLIVWQLADQLVKDTYRFTVNFPAEERFGVTSQLRRAALSIVLNIVEGNARGSKKDNHRFLLIARGSLAETRYLFDLSRELGYMSKKDYDALEQIHARLGFILQKFIASLR